MGFSPILILRKEKENGQPLKSQLDFVETHNASGKY
jgi:hypothetical protein